jgi:hypothetical protein
MKRERIPVIATSPAGETFELGHVSRVTSTCRAAFLKREGFDNLPPDAKGRDWRSLRPGTGAKRAAFASDGWVISVARAVSP